MRNNRGASLNTCVKKEMSLNPVVPKKPLYAYAYRTTLLFLALGFLLGLLGAGIMELNLFSIHVTDYLFFCFFGLSGLFLVGFAAMIVTRTLYMWISGEGLGTLKSMESEFSAASKLEVAITYGYILATVFSMFFAGCWISSCLSMLLTGKIQVLIGA